MGDDASALKTIRDNPPHRAQRLEENRVREYVARLLDRREAFLATVRKHGSPLYALDAGALKSRAREFCAAFQNRLPEIRFFYAMKSNNHPDISRILVENGLGLDVSSGEELKQAVKLNAQEIIFSGPGKTVEELTLATKYADRVTVLVDSFGELERLQRAASGANRTIRAGVRVCTDESGLWRKFGIPLSRLVIFIEKARAASHVDFCGLQFHISWNLNPELQVAFIRRLGEALKKLKESDRETISFIDIGGGYWPPIGEWLHSPDPDCPGSVNTAPGNDESLTHYYQPAVSINQFARQISGAIREFIQPHVECAVYLEPGRWLCHDAMHIIVTVLDKKDDDLVITDGGTNGVGWERFETDYFPVINLTRPDLTEHKCLIAGSLCTPHDIWGYGYWGKAIEPGDVLLIPSQGAYTYSLRQNFIKPVPQVAPMEKDDRVKIIDISLSRDIIWENIAPKLPLPDPKL